MASGLKEGKAKRKESSVQEEKGLKPLTLGPGNEVR